MVIFALIAAIIASLLSAYACTRHDTRLMVVDKDRRRRAPKQPVVIVTDISR